MSVVVHHLAHGGGHTARHHTTVVAVDVVRTIGVEIGALIPFGGQQGRHHHGTGGLCVESGVEVVLPAGGHLIVEILTDTLVVGDDVAVGLHGEVEACIRQVVALERVAHHRVEVVGGGDDHKTDRLAAEDIGVSLAVVEGGLQVLELRAFDVVVGLFLHQEVTAHRGGLFLSDRRSRQCQREQQQSGKKCKGLFHIDKFDG